LARRLRSPRIPGTGPSQPKHNVANRQTKESRVRSKLLDQSKANYFKYEMQDLLKASPVAADLHNSLIQSLWAKGSRDDIAAAREFLQDKVKDKSVDAETAGKIQRILDRYTTWR